MSRKVLIRADASPSLGGGHVMRCLALAETLHGAGWQVQFAFRPGTREAVPGLGAYPFSLREISGPPGEEPRTLHEACGETDLLVVDHYGRDAAFERSCRCFAERILVIDDRHDRPHDCDILLNQGVDRRAGLYDGLVAEDCRLCLGPEYALLRTQFREARLRALPRRQEEGPVRRMLVSMGASDNRNLVPVVLEGIAEAGMPSRVDVAIGPAAPGLSEVEALARRWPGKVKVHVGTDRMAALMTQADLAFGAAGIISWERCCLGLPSLVVVTADNQEPVALQLERHGAAEVLGGWQDVNSRSVSRVLQEHAGDASRRGRMSRRAAELCDGRGSLRLLLEIASNEVAADGKAVALRLAGADDADVMFRWQTDPRTRRYFRNREVPGREEHDRWVLRSLDDPNRLMAVILHGGQPGGVLRLDREEGDTAFDVSVHVAPDRYRLGLAGGALRIIRRAMPGARFRAWVLPGNAASQGLFLGAGYRLSGGCYLSEPQCPDAPGSP